VRLSRHFQRGRGDGRAMITALGTALEAFIRSTNAAETAVVENNRLGAEA